MGRFSNLLEGKGKDITIGNEVFTIAPLTAKHMGVLMDMTEGNKSEALFSMVLASLQQTDESITLDDIKELPMNVINDIMEVVNEVNELNNK